MLYMAASAIQMNLVSPAGFLRVPKPWDVAVNLQTRIRRYRQPPDWREPAAGPWGSNKYTLSAALDACDARGLLCTPHAMKHCSSSSVRWGLPPGIPPLPGSFMPVELHQQRGFGRVHWLLEGMHFIQAIPLRTEVLVACGKTSLGGVLLYCTITHL